LALVPVFGPTKTGRPRTISLSSAIIALLRTHRQHQRELRMANRPHYHDHDLVFAKEWSDLQRRTDCLGGPLQINNLGQREYATLIKAAAVKPIKFHGLRHTCATLLLKAGTPVHVVSERVGPCEGVHDPGSLRTRLAGHATGSGRHDRRAASRNSSLASR
jgi:integrase